jgi:hypothetical protein
MDALARRRADALARVTQSSRAVSACRFHAIATRRSVLLCPLCFDDRVYGLDGVLHHLDVVHRWNASLAPRWPPSAGQR